MMIDSLDAVSVIRAVRDEATREARREMIEDLEGTARGMLSQQPGSVVAECLLEMARLQREHYGMPASEN